MLLSDPFLMHSTPTQIERDFTPHPMSLPKRINLHQGIRMIKYYSFDIKYCN